MTDFEKKLLLEAAYWNYTYFRVNGEEDYTPREVILDMCDNVGLELNDDEFDEVLESFEGML